MQHAPLLDVASAELDLFSIFLSSSPLLSPFLSIFFSLIINNVIINLILPSSLPNLITWFDRVPYRATRWCLLFPSHPFFTFIFIYFFFPFPRSINPASSQSTAMTFILTSSCWVVWRSWSTDQLGKRANAPNDIRTARWHRRHLVACSDARLSVSGDEGRGGVCDSIFLRNLFSFFSYTT